MILIVIFDLRSATDAIHSRIPWIYLAYIGLGLGWYLVRRKKITALAPQPIRIMHKRPVRPACQTQFPASDFWLRSLAKPGPAKCTAA